MLARGSSRGDLANARTDRRCAPSSAKHECGNRAELMRFGTNATISWPRCGRYRSAKKAITTPTWPLEAMSSNRQWRHRRERGARGRACAALDATRPTGASPRERVVRATAVQHIGVQIESVRPDDRPQLRVDADLPDVGRISEGLTHRAPERLDSGDGDHQADAGAMGRFRPAARGRGRGPSSREVRPGARGS